MCKYIYKYYISLLYVLLEYTSHIYIPIYTLTSAYVIATPVSAARLFSALFAILG